MEWESALSLFLSLFVRANLYYAFVLAGYMVFEHRNYTQGFVGSYMFRRVLSITYSVFVCKVLLGLLGMYIGSTYYNSFLLSYLFGYIGFSHVYDTLDYIACKVFRLPFIRPLGYNDTQSK